MRIVNKQKPDHKEGLLRRLEVGPPLWSGFCLTEQTLLDMGT